MSDSGIVVVAVLVFLALLHNLRRAIEHRIGRELGWWQSLLTNLTALFLLMIGSTALNPDLWRVDILYIAYGIVGGWVLSELSDFLFWKPEA